MTITPERLDAERGLKLPQVLGELAEFNLKRYGEYTLLYYEGREYTNSYLADQARRLAAGLLAQGVKPGDRVLVMLINSPEVMVAYQAILRMGGVVVPLLPVLKTPEVQHIATNCKPTAAIVNLPLAAVMRPALEASKLPQAASIIAVGDAAEAKAAGLVSYSELIERSEPLTQASPAKPEELAIIIYTSGTTGKPKGVMLSHNNKISNLLAGAGDIEHVQGLIDKPKEPGLAALPLAHAYGLTVSNLAYLNGNPMVMLPRFETQRAFEAIEKYQIVNFGAVPAMLVAMLNYPEADKYDTSSLQSVVSGSAPLPESVLKGFEQRFGATIREGYGLSEATTGVSGHREGMVIKPGAVGTPKPNSGIEVQVVDHNDKPLPAHERGEIVVRGPNVMMGYYDNPAATEDTIRDGWLHTGDVGYLDEDGYIYIVERKKDLIIRGGQNVYPRDAEEVLGQHPAVMEVAVVGVPSDKHGEEVKAYVALRPGQSVTAEELIAFTQESLANYKTPAYIEFIEALPRNPIGKINKRALRDMAVGK